VNTILKAKLFLTPNHLTLLRFLLAFVGLWILATAETGIVRFLSMIILSIAALTDLLDGWLARRHGLESDTGKILDPIADKFLTLGLMSVFAYLNVYSFIWVLLFAVREVMITAIRLVAFKKGWVLAAEGMGKLKTAAQMISLLVSYLYLFSRDHWISLEFWNTEWTRSFQVANYAFLTIALILTYLSGISFLKNLKKKTGN